MTTLEQEARKAWRDWGHNYTFFGRCSSCGRDHGEDGRPLLVRAKRRGTSLCLDCFSSKE